jgi:DNA-binding GntR family transcriptional regulator
MSQVAEKAYRELKESIRRGRLQPGDRLVERTICAELQMSRTPVREALKLLTAEGLVSRRPRRGMVVSKMSEDEVREIFEFGVVLEAFVASLAAKKRDAEHVKKLKKLIKSMDACLSGDAVNKSRYVELDRRFHAEIAAAAGNQRLAGMLQQAMESRVLHQAFSRYGHQDCRQSLEQHRTILRAIQSGDPDWASSAMQTHILTGRAMSRPEQGNA